MAGRTIPKRSPEHLIRIEPEFFSQIGFHLTPFWSPTDRSPTQIIDEAIEVVHAASTMGYAWVSMGHHWLSYPTIWPQPYPLIARLAPETGKMRIKSSVLLLPLLNPVEVAENVSTLDHITHGRLVLGVAIGYREAQLETDGLTRKDRNAKLEESIELMKQLWTGQEVSFEGRYSKVTKGRVGFTPYQKPHPPIEMGARAKAPPGGLPAWPMAYFLDRRSRGPIFRTWPRSTERRAQSQACECPGRWERRAA